MALEDDPNLKKFKMKLRSFSFIFNNFMTLSGLIYIGDVNIDTKRNFAFKIISTKTSRKSGALWHSLKQRIDMGFKTTFGFKFRNPILHHERGFGMNASIVSGSVLGSPGRASHRNFNTGLDHNSIITPHRVRIFMY